MLRVNEEKNYWNKAALDPEVDKKFISDLDFNLGFKPKGKVLEIGCGVGRLMEDGFCGIDISEEMLKIARERKPNCEFKICDGRTIPYEDSSFDFVYCVLVFQHIPFAAVCSYITEAARVLKRGGEFAFQYIEGDQLEPFSIHHKARSVEYHLQKSGFKIARKTTRLIHESWTWVGAIKI